jgi:tryptophanyl-tRNA synthetase
MKERPGVSNLLQILTLLTHRDLPEVIKEHEGQTQYGPLKQTVADAVAAFLTDFQTKLTQVDNTQLMQKLEASEVAMNQTANQTLAKVQKAVGLRPSND